MGVKHELKQVPGFSSYFAGCDGTIWTSKRRGPQVGDRDELKQMTCVIRKRDGYACVVMRDDLGHRKSMSAHKVIALAFLGMRPDGMCVCHYNGDKTDNRLCNLRYDTHHENAMDRKRHGTHLCGNRVATSVVSEEIVKHIRIGLGFGVTVSEIARIFKIGRTTVKRIQTRETWAHV